MDADTDTGTQEPADPAHAEAQSPVPGSPGAEEATHPPDTDDGAVEGLVESLGMAWGVFGLYPDPSNQPAWDRACQAMADSEAFPVFAEVGTGVFVSDSEVIEGKRDGVARLVKRLFLHDVAAVKLVGPPTHGELKRFFEILGEDDDEVRRLGGVRALLINSGIESITVVQRSMLTEQDSDVEDGRDPEVTDTLRLAGDPEALSVQLIEQAANDPARLARDFVARYERVLGLVAADDFSAREEIVHLFVEAFFYLPEEFQLPVLELAVELRTKPEVELFLDQFSGHDLARFAHALPEPVQTGLYDYARVDDDGRPLEMLALLESALEVKEARRQVAGRIGEMLGMDESELERDQSYACLADGIGWFDSSLAGFTVLRNLLAIEDRDLRFRRLMRVWSGKVARAIREGDLARAMAWTRAVTDDAPYPEWRSQEVADTLRAMATPDLIQAVVDQVGDEDHAGAALLDVWGPVVVEQLIELLGNEDDPQKRRVLIGFLARVSSSDPTALLRHLSDSRWYVVRNLATVLGKIGRIDAVPRLFKLATRHADHRVRVEALRALMPLPGTKGIDAAIAALRDDNQRVRQAALSLLVTADSADVDRLLAKELDAKDVGVDTKVRLVDALAGRSTPAARRALEEVAARRARFGAAKQLRQAAKRALEGP